MKRLGVIMAGGSGERFWPLSRRDRPKQLLQLTGSGATMLQEAVDRLAALTEPEFAWIAAAPHLVEPIRHSLPNFEARNILAEPHKRNTSGCLVWVAANLLAREPDARTDWSMAVVTADHRIAPTEGFARTARAALEVAEATGGLCTLGIPPTRPETGFGYIELSNERVPNSEGIEACKVERFREKPNLADAQIYVASGRFLWNSGMFFWTLDGFLKELEAAQPEIYAAIEPIAQALRDNNPVEAAQIFESLPSISIDYALMEKSSRVYVARADFDWDDLGSWDALDRSFERDSNNNVCVGDAVVLDSKDCVVYNAEPGVVPALIGVEGLVVVVTSDAVLVCPKDRAQEVRRAVEDLTKRGLGRT